MWDTRSTDKKRDIDWDGDLFESDPTVRIFTLSKSHQNSMNNIMIAGGGQSNELRVFNEEMKPVVNITDVSRPIFT